MACASCSRAAVAGTRRRKSRKISGVMNKKTTDMVKGGGLAILAEWAADKFVGGVLTDSTGTIIKAGAGAALFFMNKSNLLKGVGAGLVVNNGLKLATGKNLPQTLGLGGPVAGIKPYYLNGVSGTPYRRQEVPAQQGDGARFL